MTKGKVLREILARPGIQVLPGVYDCLGAKLAAKVGFDVVFTSGFGISAAMLGRPDFGLLTATETLMAVENIVNAIDVPVVADIDTGYGNPLNVYRTVSDVARIGAGGIILEDQEWPKKCGHFSGKKVIPTEAHVEKICAAAEARLDSELVIIGRTDARAVEGLDAALTRGRAYFEAGADVIFVEAPQSVEELKAIASAFPDAPIFANMIEGGKTPLLSAMELERIGFKIAVFPLTGLFAATRATLEAFQYLKEQSTTEGLGEKLTFPEFEQILDVPFYRDLESKFSKDSKD